MSQRWSLFQNWSLVILSLAVIGINIWLIAKNPKFNVASSGDLARVAQDRADVSSCFDMVDAYVSETIEKKANMSMAGDLFIDFDFSWVYNGAFMPLPNRQWGIFSTGPDLYINPNIVCFPFDILVSGMFVGKSGATYTGDLKFQIWTEALGPTPLYSSPALADTDPAWITRSTHYDNTVGDPFGEDMMSTTFMLDTPMFVSAGTSIEVSAEGITTDTRISAAIFAQRV